MIRRRCELGWDKVESEVAEGSETHWSSNNYSADSELVD